MKQLLSILTFFMLSVTTGFGQIVISGSIHDAETKAPLPYCNISIKNSKNGVITNEQGKFRVKLRDENAILSISYLSYKTMEIPAVYFLKKNKLYLKKDIYILAEARVFANDDYLYEMLADCSKRNQEAKQDSSKAYFSLETVTGERPVEVIECYYNAFIEKNNPDYLFLKNGRIALAALNDFYYVSLSTSDMLCSYNIFNKGDGYLYKNPLQFGKRAMMKRYKLELLAISGDNGNIYRISFKPKNENDQLFEGEIWIKTDTKNLLKLSIKSRDLADHPFTPIHPSHKVSDVNLTMDYNFMEDSGIYRPELIRFSYSFDYYNGMEQKPVESTGILYFFDYENLFYTPRFSAHNFFSSKFGDSDVLWLFNGNPVRSGLYKTDNSFTDYDKIVSMPYNDFFWENTSVILNSDKKKSYIRFFEKNGVLLNYKKLSGSPDKLFMEKKRPWSADERLTYTFINEQKSIFEDKNGNKTYFSPMVISDLYNLEGQIFMDINSINDSIHVLTKTLIDIDESFYFIKPDMYTNCFINTYFDLIELQRRKLEENIRRNPYSVMQIDSVYRVYTQNMEETLDLYLSECERGQKTEELKKWTELVKKSLGTDNFLMISKSARDETEGTIESDSLISPVSKYNEGTIFYKTGKYEEAKTLFMEAIDAGDKHPWLYYNLALTCHKLGDNENACKYIQLSIEAGEKTETGLLEELCR